MFHSLLNRGLCCRSVALQTGLVNVKCLMWCVWFPWSREFRAAWDEKKFQKHVAAEFIGTLLVTFLAGAGVL